MAIRHQPRARLRPADGHARRPGPYRSGPEHHNNHIARSKLNYQFTRALSVRAIVDYYAQLPNHPGTAVYVGYTNRFQNLGVDPSDPLSLIPIGGPVFQTNRLLFIKLSYLFRF